MGGSSTTAVSVRRPLFSTRKIVHMSMLIFAFLLPFLTWLQAAGCAVLALLFNVFILPHLGADFSKRPVAVGFGPAQLAGAPDLNPAHAALKGASTDSGATPSVWTGIVIYPLSVLALIVFYPNTLQVAGAVWAIMALGDGLASVAGEALRGPVLPWNKEKTWSGFIVFVMAGSGGAYTLVRWVGPSIPAEKAALVCLATALLGALVESAPIRLDDNLTVPLVCGAFMFCAFMMERSQLHSNLPYLGRRIWIAVGVNLVLALLALGMKTVDRSGAAMGFVVGVAVYMAWGYKSFLVMFAFFVLGSLGTRLGYAKKAARGVAEKRGGARSWREALANSLAGAFFAILVITTLHEKAFLIALVAAFAEAAGDTISSEIGQWISRRAYLITTLKPVPAGENGGISLGGTLAGILASALVVALAFGLGLIGKGGAAMALAAAFVGNLIDSVLGATLERRGLVTNGIVNFAGTSCAGAMALAVALHMGF
ncbi:MAG: DUF92 domain-containing protein [Acidobacteriia bacterium]|nr:DUF92 domain-containing protein [Terriglobia bacterium]